MGDESVESVETDEQHDFEHTPELRPGHDSTIGSLSQLILHRFKYPIAIGILA